jgi:hypothetical protein
MPQFSLPLQNDFVIRHGDKVAWRRANKCPCSSRNEADANRARTNCPLCDGFGYMYDAPVLITGLVTGISFNKQLLDLGIVNPGDLLLGLAPGERNLVTDFDIINLVSFGTGENYDGDTITRDPDGAPDELSYTPVNVLSCFSANGNDDGTDWTRTDYVQNVDFTLDGRDLTWLPGKGPEKGSTFSIKYTARFDWEAYSSPSIRFEAGVNIGQRVLLRKRELPVPLFK